MSRAGYLLVGGQSSRMGRDKALLPWRGHTLVEYLAAVVRRAAGSVTLIGDPARYAHLGLPLTADAAPGTGPLGGIYTALLDSDVEHHLVVACDMPEVTAEFLSTVLAAAERSAADCVLPAGSSGHPEPLCAVYHTRCRAPLAAALAAGIRKVTDALKSVRVEILPVLDDTPLRNCNTPEDWRPYKVEDAAGAGKDD